MNTYYFINTTFLSILLCCYINSTDNDASVHMAVDDRDNMQLNPSMNENHENNDMEGQEYNMFSYDYHDDNDDDFCGSQDFSSSQVLSNSVASIIHHTSYIVHHISHNIYNI